MKYKERKCRFWHVYPTNIQLQSDQSIQCPTEETFELQVLKNTQQHSWVFPKCASKRTSFHVAIYIYSRLSLSRTRYLELPLISKWKSGPCFNMKLWREATK